MSHTTTVAVALLLSLTLDSASLSTATDSEPDNSENSQLALIPSLQSLSSFEILIVGGERVTDTTKYPFFVRIFYGKGSQFPKSRCGGSIISANKIVTAAHCLNDIQSPTRHPDQLYIVAGCLTPHTGKISDPLMSDADTCVIIDVDSFRIHPAYYFNESAGQIINDVAVLTLSKNFDFGNKSARNKYIQRIKLAPTFAYKRFEDFFDIEVSTIGSGCTKDEDRNRNHTKLENSSNNSYLHTLTYHALLRELCTSTSDGVLCAKSYRDPTAGICLGDSGSSLICRKKGTRYSLLCGITSQRRLKSNVDVFMDASFYHEWIINNKTDSNDSTSESDNSGIVVFVVAVGWIALAVLGSVCLYYSKDWILNRWNAWHGSAPCYESQV